ncbi:Ppx/GppA phosphatase family protein [Peteryoungia ipomoeae]|uniref:Ppx/GppA phosphatase family protein n=1 Tax=Peteryoungia ipomoeae TaxID=1210932 RepID=UPI0014562BA7|nr:Ppx/GppA phosphatase family protein [Peteryoungia ipomoeae]
MTDPDRGGQPKNDGASPGKRKGGGSRRRGKGRQSAPVAKGVDGSASAALAATPGADRRSPTAFSDGPVRKRKRRRRGKAGVNAGGVEDPAFAKGAPDPRSGPTDQHGARETAATASEQDGRLTRASGAGELKSDAAGGVDSENRPGKKRRRNRNRRGGARAAAKGGHIRPLAGSEPPASVARKTRPSLAVAAPTHAPQPTGRIDRPVSPSRARSGEEGGQDDLYAALDLGTNNCRLLIAQPTRPGQFRVVDAFSRIVRLGEGLGASGQLSQDAMDRAVDALRICASKLSGREIRRMRLIATEACRAAENGEGFLERVRVETGLELEIINRETEARLAVSGCSSLVGREARSVVLFDIGGGSSEIAVIRIADNRSSRLANHITHWTSLPVGVVTLSERHGGRDVTPQIFEDMIQEVAGMLARFECPDLPLGADGYPEDFHLIGTSGTVTTLAGVHLDLPRYDRRKVDGVWLSDQEVSAMQAKLLSWDYAGRAANPCIGPDRADLVLAGCAILEAIRRRWPSNRMRVADRGLREGLLTDMMADDGVWRRGRIRRPHTHRER